MIKPGIYRHYKGQFYNVIGIAKHSETLEELVMYQQLYDDYGFWVRPKIMFCERVMIGDQSVARFELVTQAPPHIAQKEKRDEESKE